ncbi:hypothetical protein [Chryseobacterium sp. MYb328]|uniref:hypothetical protein n=1 Tax=Chryseobacterium sp. MYb328 TaxID=2745231 RepID=UPI0030B77885
MKNPKVNPEIEAIKNRLRNEILPEGFIPNSRVAKQLDLLDAMATLEYAKSLNRPVRMAKPGECEAIKKEIYKQYQKDPNKPAGMLSSKEAADKIGIKISNLWQQKKNNTIKAVRVGSRNYYSEAEIIRFRATHYKTA